MAGVMGQSVDLGVPNNAVVSAYAASLVVKAAPGRVIGFTVYNSKGSGQFIQLYDAASLPADNAVPVYVGTVATVANLQVEFGPRGKYFATGIVIGNSSTGPTKTIGSADCWFEVRYI